MAAERPVFGVETISAVGQEPPVLGIHDEQQAIEQDKAFGTAVIEVSGGEAVRRVAQETFDRQLQSVESPFFQPFADTDSVVAAALDRALNQGAADIGRAVAGGSEEQEKFEEFAFNCIFVGDGAGASPVV